MSNHGLDTGEQPYDDRHNAMPEQGMEELREQGFPMPANGDRIGNDHQESTGFFRPSEPLPRRVVARDSLTVPPLAGLSWAGHAAGPVRADLVNFGFDLLDPHDNRPLVSNIELRTIYAHLLETAGRVRAEMRERGMQVDL